MQVRPDSFYGGGVTTRATAARGDDIACSAEPRDVAILDSGTVDRSPLMPRFPLPTESRVSVARVQAIASNPDPVVRNLQITDYYHDVALALRDMIGPEGGNNWPAWAGWASKHVGEHVRREDLPFLRGTCKVTTAIARAILPASIHAAVWGPSDAMDRAHEAISKANNNIFSRTCKQFSRFIETFQGDTEPNQSKWTRFAAGFKPGPYEEGGEDLLRDGFRSYYEAMFEPDAKKKAELVLLGNCQIVHDEQKHAHEEINVAIPRFAGRPVTSWSLYLDTPNEMLRLGRDLPSRPDGRTFPALLEEIQNPRLAATYKQHDRSRGIDRDGTIQGSRCHDYRRIEDRMNMIVNIFRTRHDDSSLFNSPFTPEQRVLIQQGKKPEGKL